MRIITAPRHFALLAAFAAVIAGAAHAADTGQASSTATAIAPASGSESGLAAVYSDRLIGHRTASGALYDANKLTAAHKTLAFGTKIKVTNTRNGKSVELKVTDRGPKQADRVLDISPRAARTLGISKHAMAPVTIEVLT